jgi:hypothetical protein
MSKRDFDQEIRDSQRVSFVLRVLYYAVWPITITVILITNHLTLGKAPESPNRHPTHVSRVVNPPHP